MKTSSKWGTLMRDLATQRMLKLEQEMKELREFLTSGQRRVKGPGKQHRGMSPAARKVISERMKAYWASPAGMKKKRKKGE